MRRSDDDGRSAQPPTAQIGPAHSRIRHQRVVRAVEHDTAGLQNVAAIARLERFRRALFHKQNCKARFAMHLVYSLEDVIDDGRRHHGRLVEHQELGRSQTRPNMPCGRKKMMSRNTTKIAVFCS